MKKLTLLSLIVILIIPVLSARAQTPSGIAVIGDSISHEYRCINRGTATAFNWVESSQRIRGVNYGAMNTSNCYAFDYAYSGYTVVGQMSGMVTSIISAWTKGNINRVVILLGSNDIGNGTAVSLIVSTYTTQVQRLKDAGIAGGNILIAAVPQQDCSSGAWNANITSLNTQLASLATTKGTAFADYSAFCNLLNTYNGGNPNTSAYNYGGQSIARYTWCNTTCIRIPDGHPGTVAQAILFNAMIAPFLGVSPMTEAEVLALMGIGTSPTQTLSNTPSPTATRTPTATATASNTPTATFTPSPTSTPAPFVLDCGAGWHWVAIDAQRVQCLPN